MSKPVPPGSCFSRNLIKLCGTFAAAVVIAAIPLVSGGAVPSHSLAIMWKLWLVCWCRRSFILSLASWA